MMRYRACNMFTNVLCPLLVKEPPWTISLTSLPCVLCELQIFLVADDSVDLIGLTIFL